MEYNLFKIHTELEGSGEVALDRRQLLILIRKWKDNSIRILKKEMSCGE